MKQYRKKPVVISAMPYNGANFRELESHGVKFVLVGDRIAIETLEGNGHELAPGDMVIRGIRGEFYPCKPDIFAATYDEVPWETE